VLSKASGSTCQCGWACLESSSSCFSRVSHSIRSRQIFGPVRAPVSNRICTCCRRVSCPFNCNRTPYHRSPPAPVMRKGMTGRRPSFSSVTVEFFCRRSKTVWCVESLRSVVKSQRSRRPTAIAHFLAKPEPSRGMPKSSSPSRFFRLAANWKDRLVGRAREFVDALPVNVAGLDSSSALG